MKQITINLNLKIVALAVLVLIVVGGMVKSKNLNAQTAGGNLSGTFVCLTSSHFAGYIVSKTADTNNSGINQLFTVSFDATNNTATFMGLVANQVSNFEKTNASTSTIATASSLQATVIPNSPSAYLYKLVDTSQTSNNTYYLGLTNSGNTLLFTGAPNTTSTMHGACQKV